MKTFPKNSNERKKEIIEWNEIKIVEITPKFLNIVLYRYTPENLEEQISFILKKKILR